ncbi:MAG: YqgE/AlgH family protein [Bacteroidales bacterium]|nr:YqgE/AlgH family protein [Bacteroidales bacterium]
MDLNIDFFHIVNENVVEKGRILISEPFLSDNHFHRSIVYLAEHNEEGSLGFVLNKPLEIGIAEIVDDFPESEFSISMGGPVSNNTVHYIHTLGERIPGSVLIADGIFWGGDFDSMKSMIAEGGIKPFEIRFFVGYAGWSADQLEGEMKANAWLVGNISPRMLMQGVETEFWSDTLARYNNKYRAWANFPEDPGLN